MLRTFDAWIDNLALPTWADRGFDTTRGLFHERLAWNGAALPVPQRAMVQARQIYVFAHAAMLGLFPAGLDLATRAMHGLLRDYGERRDGETSFCFSLDLAAGVPHSTVRDAYTHAFVLLAIAYLYRATEDQRLVSIAREVTTFVERRLVDRASGGIVDALPLAPLAAKRQNPQMHLLEAYIALEEAMPNNGYLELARSLVDLFQTRLFRRDTGAVLEYFDAAWGPHPDPGRAAVVEPGHLYEWIWLLDQYERLSGAELTIERTALWQTARQTGHAASGLIHDEVDANGTVRPGGYRLWPHTEAIKAAATLHRAGATDAQAFANDMAQQLMDCFLVAPLRGGWIDHLAVDGSPRVDYMPASSLYHLFLGSIEGRAAFAADTRLATAAA